MVTQINNSDGSLGIIKNVEGDKGKLNLILESLKSLTEPQKINEMIAQMYQKGILTEFDLIELKSKGIYQENEQSVLLEQGTQSQEQTHFGDKDFSIGGNDDIDDLEL